MSVTVEVPKEKNRESVIERLDSQPSREEALHHIHLLTERTDIFTPMQIGFIKFSLTALRDQETISDSFRTHVATLTRNLFMAATGFTFSEIPVTTPLGYTTIGTRVEAPIAIFFINRAGLTMGLEAARYLPANTPFGEFDIHRDEKSLEAIFESANLPGSIDGCQVQILDPMDATGNSVLTAWDVICTEYIRKRQQKIIGVAFCHIIAAPLGVMEVKSQVPEAQIYTVALDDHLTRPGETEFPPGYIVPGLGDAGNRQFGPGRTDLFIGAQDLLRRFINFDSPDRIKLTHT